MKVTNTTIFYLGELFIVMVAHFRGLTEIPAYAFTPIPIAKFGRRPTTSCTFILTGLSLVALSQISACELKQKSFLV